MVAPNMLHPTLITGRKIAPVALTTSAAAILSNAASSGKVLKIVDLRVTNVDGTNAATVTVYAYPEDDAGGSGVAIAHTITVPPNSVLVLASNNNPILLEEDQSIGGEASANGDLVASGSYLEIS